MIRSLHCTRVKREGTGIKAGALSLYIVYTLKLALFISSLLTDGKITVEGSFAPADTADRETAVRLLKDFYERDRYEMPHTVPAFDEHAAIWAAVYLYTAVQLAVDREADETMIKEKLQPFTGAITPEAVYSADLVLRQLPILMGLVKGLAPADFLLQELVQTAAAWPFSSVGYSVENISNEDVLFGTPSLMGAYLDRIIRAKDKNRMKKRIIQEHVRSIAGNHTELVWPGLELINNEHDE